MKKPTEINSITGKLPIKYVKIVNPKNPSEELSGMYFEKEPKIHIMHDLGFDQNCNTIIHEFLHHIANYSNTHLSEKQVYDLTLNIVHMIRNNPELIKYITQE